MVDDYSLIRAITALLSMYISPIIINVKEKNILQLLVHIQCGSTPSPVEWNKVLKLLRFIQSILFSHA